jgi:deoxyribonuclease V
VGLQNLHLWDLTPAEAIELQWELAPMVRCEGLPGEVELVAGVDVAYAERAPAWAASTARAAAVVMSYPGLEVIEHHVALAPVTFPYVPGLLSFREIPALGAVLSGLKTRPDLLIVDGHGIAHPRRLGIASHLGLLAGIPTIGCAKSRLCGEADDVGPERGSVSSLHDGAEVIGSVVRTKDGAKPVFVSAGHLISLEAAVEWVLRFAPTHRLPEPTRIADRLSKGGSIR